MFARAPGAVAAPTAGLHFDAAMLDALAARGVERTFLTLHVGAGTFAPVRTERIEDHELHAEWLEVSAATCAAVERCRKRGGRVVAVGTTSVRALETAARGGTLAPFAGESRLFIYPGFEFRVVDAMVTNFHLPESSLLMLVCAFAGPRGNARGLSARRRAALSLLQLWRRDVRDAAIRRARARMKFELMTRDGGARRGRITFRRGVDRHAGVHAGRHLRHRESDDARGARGLGRADHPRQHVPFAAAPRHRGHPRARRPARVHALASGRS